mmetsp:Transcript_24436/g.35727  ORF Transcript_24436/g.35727 Transcript_24436/m.35727 type:complete len:291 (-) Transcript_24436:173-1045(-)
MGALTGGECGCDFGIRESNCALSSCVSCFSLCISFFIISFSTRISSVLDCASTLTVCSPSATTVVSANFFACSAPSTAVLAANAASSAFSLAMASSFSNSSRAASLPAFLCDAATKIAAAVMYHAPYSFKCRVSIAPEVSRDILFSAFLMPSISMALPVAAVAAKPFTAGNDTAGIDTEPERPLNKFSFITLSPFPAFSSGLTMSESDVGVTTNFDTSMLCFVCSRFCLKYSLSTKLLPALAVAAVSLIMLLDELFRKSVRRRAFSPAALDVAAASSEAAVVAFSAASIV